jgi:hypothetical protein
VDGRLVRAPHDREGEVRPIEPGRDPHRIAQPEAPDDVGRDTRSRRGGGREDGARPDRPGDLAEAKVVGSEVVPPLAHAVGLIHDEQADLGLAEPVDKARCREPLRGDVQHVDLPPDRPLQRGAVRGPVALRVDELRAPAEALDLIHHQRDERRDDHREVAIHKRRKLVAGRLAGAGRHHEEHVATMDRPLDRRALARPEIGVAEVAAQRLGERVRGHPF